MFRIMRVPAVIGALSLLVLAAVHVAADAPGNPAFQTRWERTDDPVLNGQVARTWIWGPEANTGVMQEAYAESPGHQRDVQYYDKSRMEINNPSGDPTNLFYVTNGLLVIELMTGNLQLGDNTFEHHNPAVINVAGDADDPTSPTYVTLAALRSLPPVADNAVITQRVDRAGVVSDDPTLAGQQVTAAYHVVVPGIDHQIASPFWTFMNSTGLVKENGQYVNQALFTNPFYATGYPITEAYWARVKVAGTYKDVLMQCFERRCLTYTPGNPAGFATEAGNVGQHYRVWRYIQIPGEGSPTATSTSTSEPPAYEYVAQFGRATDENRTMNLPWSVARDDDGNLYVIDIGANRVQKFNSNGEFLLEWGSFGAGDSQFNGPTDIEVGPDGNIYVVDTGNNQIKIFDVNGTYLSSIGEQGSGDGQFNYPTGIAFSIHDGSIFVTDGDNDRVEKFDSEGGFLLAWGEYGSDPSQFAAPSAVAVSASETVYVVDGNNDRVQAFTSDGVFLKQWGGTGTDNGQFAYPAGIVIQPPNDTVYISDTGNNRVQVFDAAGNWQSTMGEAGAGPGQLNAPHGLAVSDQDVIVADSGNARVQALRLLDGTYNMQFNGDSRGTFDSIDGLAIGPGGYYAVADYGANLIKLFNADGTFMTEFGANEFAPGSPLDNPTDVAISADDLIYVADGNNDRIVIYLSSGLQLNSFGGTGSGDGQLDNPTGVSVAPNGNVFVVDSNNDRVEVFSSIGEYLYQWGGSGSGDGQFLIPIGIYASSTHVYVVDKGNSRVQVFDPAGNYLFQFGEYGAGDGQFITPWRVTADADGFIYVSSDNRVQKFTPDGNYVETIGRPGSDDGELNLPLGVAIDASGNLVVVDAGNSRLQVFAPPQ